MTELATTGDEAAPPALDAYALLSKPTLQLTDSDVDILVADLRKRRDKYLASGKPDVPKKAAAAVKALAEPKAKPTASEKAAATKALLDEIDWKL